MSFGSVALIDVWLDRKGKIPRLMYGSTQSKLSTLYPQYLPEGSNGVNDKQSLSPEKKRSASTNHANLTPAIASLSCHQHLPDQAGWIHC